MKFPMLTSFAYIIHSISSSKTENEINLSLAGIYTSSLCTNISVEMLSDLLFININSAALVRNKTIDVYRVLLDAVSDIVDEMESNSY